MSGRAQKNSGGQLGREMRSPEGILPHLEGNLE